jgi:hypothetical protein
VHWVAPQIWPQIRRGASRWAPRHDVFSPFPHGPWLASHVPGAHAPLLDDDGHLSMWTTQVPAKFDELPAHGVTPQQLPRT